MVAQLRGARFELVTDANIRPEGRIYSRSAIPYQALLSRGIAREVAEWLGYSNIVTYCDACRDTPEAVRQQLDAAV